VAPGFARVIDFIRVCAHSAASTVAPSLARWLLARAAIAPPMWKTPLFERCCAGLVRGSLGAPEDVVVTNFGLGADLRCQIAMKKTAYAFGKFEHMLSERATFALLRELAADCKEFVDVGANEGAFTFLVRHNYPKVRLHWFEPDRELARHLAANLASNDIVACGNEMAVAERRGTATFFKNLNDDASGSLSSLFTDKHLTRAEPVETISLAEYFGMRGIANALVKIDVEGAGEKVWNGAVETSNAIRYLVMEMLAPEIEAGLPARIIREGGLKAYYIRDFELIPSLDGEFEYVAPFWNWLFCRMPPSELAARLAASGFRVGKGG
jgi:FkbM family methyltransferase